jgi:hypothetical protein
MNDKNLLYIFAKCPSESADKGAKTKCIMGDDETIV